MRVATLFVRHGTAKYCDAERQLEEFFEKHLPDVERKTLVIDNALPSEFCEVRDQGKTVIGGDNTSWEFSAWDKGLRYLGNDVWTFDWIHLVTSAFRTLYTAYLDRFDYAMMQAAAGRPVCLGHIDCYNEPVRLRSFHSQHWMRTSFLFLPPAELKSLRSLVSIPNPVDIFGTSPEQPFFPDAPLSADYRTYILDWLTGAEIGQGSSWHSRYTLDAASWPLFQAKAKAILNEHLLAIRLRAQGTYLVDVTWLRTQMKSLTADQIEWEQSWRGQLAGRDVDRVLVP